MTTGMVPTMIMRPIRSQPPSRPASAPGAASVSLRMSPRKYATTASSVPT